jgi:uncharacterized protein YcbK (DUF882 family)
MSIFRPTRRHMLGLFAAGAVSAAPVMSKATGFLRGSGDIRRLRMSNLRTGERLDMIYWLEGDYIQPALSEINFFMRDWRSNSAASIDRRTIDIMAAVQKLLDTDTPLTLLSGYRSPATNSMLRSQSSGVAQNSYHIRGQAADITCTSRSIHHIYSAARACGGGGVGRYSSSNFVHVDSGPVRSWGS